MTRKDEMEAIAGHILRSFEDRCKNLENLAQEFKNMLEKSGLQHRGRLVRDEEIHRQCERILCEADTLLQDIERERIETARVFDGIWVDPKGRGPF